MAGFAGDKWQGLLGSDWGTETPSFQPVNLRSASGAGAGGDGAVQPMLGGIDRDASELIGSAPRVNSAAQGRMAGDAINAVGEVSAARMQADAAKEAAQARSRGSAIGGILSTVGSVAGGLLALCDERVKEDIAPLTSAPANDLLSELAYAVRDLREHP